MFALVDANNMYVSCERVFAPRLAGKPAGLGQPLVDLLGAVRVGIEPAHDLALEGVELEDKDQQLRATLWAVLGRRDARLSRLSAMTWAPSFRVESGEA